LRGCRRPLLSRRRSSGLVMAMFEVKGLDAAVSPRPHMPKLDLGSIAYRTVDAVCE
jgi:hypothetical protein